jgi:hypothetical protein
VDLRVTATRWATVVGTFAAVVLWPWPSRADLFSPGELAQMHAHLEGLSQCTQCHPSGGQLSQEKCIACHTEIGARVSKQKGYHGKMPDAQRACETCHHDHQGRSFELIEWVPSKKEFPHEKTGWALSGKHAKVACEDCHQPRRITQPDAKKLLEHPQKKETYLGLPTACASCHFDEHRAQLGRRCQACHAPTGFAEAKGFNHQKTDYPLTGAHKSVACKECHPTLTDTKTPKDAFPAPVSMSFAKYSKVAHGTCEDCHADPHQGQLGPQCDSCHVTESWATLKNVDTNLSFHDKTRYPLRGMHKLAPCRGCHGPFGKEPAKYKELAFEKCTDCHADAHLGQLTQASAAQGCEGCHSVDGFLPPRFELADHQKTSYPLEGAHRVAACSGCHVQTPSLAEKISQKVRRALAHQKRPERFSLALFAPVRGGPTRCETCHRDVHEGQFAKREGGCAGCHQTTDFAAVTFDHDRESRFPLVGAHAKVACGGCHRPVPGKPTRYRPLEMTCESCHADPHGGQFAERVPAKACEDCHTPKDFQQTRFEHSPPFTTFELEGKHAQVKCEACHPVAAVGPARIARYVGVPTTCEGCHDDFHRGEFQGFSP